MRKNSIKNTRINGEVQRVLAEIIRGDIKDPRISPLTSVVAVEVAPDLKHCKAYISVLGNEQAQKDTLAGLKSAEGFVRRQLAKELNLRNTPELKFILDNSIEYGVTMSKKIADVTADLSEEEEEVSAESTVPFVSLDDVFFVSGCPHAARLRIIIIANTQLKILVKIVFFIACLLVFKCNKLKSIAILSLYHKLYQLRHTTTIQIGV